MVIPPQVDRAGVTPRLLVPCHRIFSVKKTAAREVRRRVVKAPLEKPTVKRCLNILPTRLMLAQVWRIPRGRLAVKRKLKASLERLIQILPRKIGVKRMLKASLERLKQILPQKIGVKRRLKASLERLMQIPPRKIGVNRRLKASPARGLKILSGRIAVERKLQALPTQPPVDGVMEAYKKLRSQR